MTRLHLDTDLGGDIDDLCALALALSWPAVELTGITTNQDDRGRRAGDVRNALHLAGREDVPVAAGADVALGCFRIFPGLPDAAVYWPEPIPPAPSSLDVALDLLERSIRQAATIVALGTYTNLALLERRAPGILRDARLVLMGGYVYPPRAGLPAWNHEMDWNVQNDVQSAFAVIQRGDPLFVPLTVTLETALRRADLPALRAAGPLTQLIARQAEAFAADQQNEARYGQTCAGLPDDTINFQHDPLACAIALGWRDGVEISTLPLRTELRDGGQGPAIDAARPPTPGGPRIDGARV
jgi:inosine-uridine nucleoside N-ribohydrolase